MDTILEIWQSIVGEAPTYTSSGNYNQIWDYGELLEYAFVCIATIFVIALVFKLLFTMFTLIFGGRNK